MRNRTSISVFILFIFTLYLTPFVSGQVKSEAVLSGHAVVPLMSILTPPEDVPGHLQTSGKYTHPDSKRRDDVGAISGKDRNRPRVKDVNLPVEGQPFQGFSGIRMLKDGTAVIVTDNGFGTAKNSPDAILMFHRIKFDWEKGEVELLKTINLHDPDRVIPFRITNEATDKRYLTGADIDPESIQAVGDSVFIGDEFGPYIIRTDLDGKLTGFWELSINGKTLRSPDHYTFQSLPVPGPVTFDVKKSRGFESMAVSPDGKYLYPIVEAPLWIEETRSFENLGGTSFVRIYEFDIEKGSFTGRSFKYALGDKGNSVTDFNLINDRTGLVIERDPGEGDASLACNGNKAEAAAGNCFDDPARFKRIYKIDMGDVDEDGFVKKAAYIDLLDIKDPNGVSRLEVKGPVFTFPFETTEGVDVYDPTHIVVLNDNNFGFSSGRTLGKNDDNEFILLEVGEFLK
jgi:hypothetical protein